MIIMFTLTVPPLYPFPAWKFDFISYLALVTAIVSEADYVFIPESPPPNDWAKKLCDKLMQARNLIITKKKKNPP